MFQNVNAGIGAVYSPVYVMAYNRTGATLSLGHVAMPDISGTQSETSGSAPHNGNPNGSYANVTPVTQTLLENGYPIWVAAESIADNALGKFCMFGEIKVMVLGDTPATNEADKGDPISMLVSDSAVAVQAWATGLTSGNRFLGIFLEDGGATTTTTTKWCLWTGGVPCMGASDS